MKSKSILYKRQGCNPYLAFGILGIVAAEFLFGCTYGPVFSQLSIKNTGVKPGTNIFVVAVRYVKERLPTGINAFPDGGKFLVLEQQALFYICDADKKSVRLLAKVGAPKHLWIHFTPWIKGWEGEQFYFQLTGCAHTPCAGNTGYQNEYYVMNLNGMFHKVEQIPPGVRLNSVLGDLKHNFVIDQEKQALVPVE